MGQFSIVQLLLGAVLAMAVSLLSLRVGALSRSGAVASTVLGLVIFGLGGYPWAILLLAFFISSSALSRMAGGQKLKLVEKFSKSSTRDWGQVLANGGISGVFVLFHLAFPEQVWPWLGFAGTLAAVNADTWATELGVLSPWPPRHLITGKRVESGTSGAVSFGGTLASFLGGLLIAMLAVLFLPQDIGESFTGNRLVWMIFIALAGLFGSLVDSFLGATVQVIYYCPACQKETEKHPFHICLTPTSYWRGWHWMNNDVVNLACAISGGFFMLLVTSLF